MRIINRSQNTLLADKAQKADALLARLVGLLNRNSLADGEALIISDCRCIHMMFMRFAIDVVFTDKTGKVVGVVRNVRPFFFSPYYWRAYYAIECPVGVIGASGTRVGDELEWA